MKTWNFRSRNFGSYYGGLLFQPQRCQMGQNVMKSVGRSLFCLIWSKNGFFLYVRNKWFCLDKGNNYFSFILYTFVRYSVSWSLAVIQYEDIRILHHGKNARHLQNCKICSVFKCWLCNTETHRNFLKYHKISLEWISQEL